MDRRHELTDDSRAQSSQQRRRLLLMGGLAVVALALCWRTLGPSLSSAATDTPEAPAVIQPPPRFGPAPTHDWPLAMHRDPFDSPRIYPPPPEPQPEPVVQTPDEPPAAPPQPDIQAMVRDLRATVRLDGIMSGPRPVAIINGRTYTAGQTVGAYQISRIEAHRIIVTRDGFNFSISPTE